MEYVENLFDALCSTLMTPQNKMMFVEAEGVELMVLILKQKKPVRFSALKAVVRIFLVQISNSSSEDGIWVKRITHCCCF